MAKDHLTEVWKEWDEDRSPERMSKVLQAAAPIIQSAKKRYAGQSSGSPSIDLKAKVLAAKALPKYDPGKGAKLSSYLFQQIAPISRAQHEFSQAFSIPKSAWTDLQNMQSEMEKLEDDLGREPSTLELSEASGLNKRRIRDLRKFRARGLPESLLRREDPENVLRTRSREDSGQQDIWAEAVYDGLDPRDQLIMEWRTGMHGKEKLPNQEIAKKLGISAAAVSQHSGQIADQLSEMTEGE